MKKSLLVLLVAGSSQPLAQGQSTKHMNPKQPVTLPSNSNNGPISGIKKTAEQQWCFTNNDCPTTSGVKATCHVVKRLKYGVCY